MVITHKGFGATSTPFTINGLEQQEQQFNARIDALPEAHREYALGIYANAFKGQ